MSRILELGNVELSSGVTLPDVRVAYSSVGRLAPTGDNVILVTHGFTSAHTMIEADHVVAEGSWAPIIGPDLPLDTNRYFVVCSNMLGSAFGTTGPRSENPATGQPWGPAFPSITLGDIVHTQFLFLSRLGVRRLRAVLGPSYGGFQALQWALDHPQMVDAIGVVTSDFNAPANTGRSAQIDRLSVYPQWNGGWYYGSDSMTDALIDLRLRTLRAYGAERVLQARGLDPDAAAARLRDNARRWAEAFDANSLLVLAEAAEHFDVRHRVSEIRARTLMVQVTTDALFPANDVSRHLLNAIPAPVRYCALDNPYGHMGAAADFASWQQHLAWLLDDSST